MLSVIKPDASRLLKTNKHREFHTPGLRKPEYAVVGLRHLFPTIAKLVLSECFFTDYRNFALIPPWYREAAPRVDARGGPIVAFVCKSRPRLYLSRPAS